MNRRLSFQTRLFALYSLLVVAIIASGFILFYWYYHKANVETLVRNYQREASSLSRELDNTIYMMDRLLMQIKYNPTVSNTLYYLPFQSDGELYFENNKDQADELKEVISSIIGVDPQFYYRVSIIGRSGAFLGVGAYYDKLLARQRAKELDWFGRLSDQSIYRLLLPPHKDDWDRTGNQVVSVIRKIGDSANVQSLVEIQIPYSSIERAVLRNSPGGMDKKIIIASRTGEQVYPLPEASGGWMKPYSGYFASAGQDQEGYDYLELPGGDKELVVHHTGQYTDWTVIMVQSQRAFLEPTRRVGYLLAGVALLIIALTLLTLYFSTKRLVSPLRQLRDTMNMVNLDSMGPAQEHHLFAGAELHNTHNELHHLYHSFRKMMDRLEDSKEQAIEARSRELKSHFVALQAQINPHFLYNTLSLIGVMGHETGNDNIMDLTAMLADMFRYITYSNGQPVALKEELRHASNYLTIMKIRYEEHLQFHIEAEEEMAGFLIPKISLQPFVENCFKHGFAKKRHPWRVEVRCYRQSELNVVEIADDGGGFPDSFLEWFPIRAAEVASGPFMLSGTQTPGGDNGGEPGGSGMLNTYARLYHFFEYGLDFQLFNKETGGAVVRIGWRNGISGKGGDKHAAGAGGG